MTQTELKEIIKDDTYTDLVIEARSIKASLEFFGTDIAFNTDFELVKLSKCYQKLAAHCHEIAKKIRADSRLPAEMIKL